MARMGMFNRRARRARSVWVVALDVHQHMLVRVWMAGIPEWVSDNEERNVQLVCAFENLVAALLDHVPVGNDDGPAIELFLAVLSDSGQHTDLDSSMGRNVRVSVCLPGGCWCRLRGRLDLPISRSGGL